MSKLGQCAANMTRPSGARQDTKSAAPIMMSGSHQLQTEFATIDVEIANSRRS
jgi:hypothetical protein